jgi:hypothetical protein
MLNASIQTELTLVALQTCRAAGLSTRPLLIVDNRYGAKKILWPRGFESGKQGKRPARADA